MCVCVCQKFEIIYELLPVFLIALRIYGGKEVKKISNINENPGLRLRPHKLMLFESEKISILR